MTWKGYGLVVRHGVTAWDSSTRGPRIEGGTRQTQPQERVTGWLDLPLRHEGIQEVQATAKKLEGFPLDLIASSSLQRCLVTARAIQADQPDVPIHPFAQLRAWNTGLYSGQLAKDVQQNLDMAVKYPHTPIPWGESFDEFVQRFLPFAWKLVQDPRLIAIVTHGMNLEVLREYAKTGTVRFQKYTGITGEVQPGEAVFITPTGVEEIAA